MCIFHKWDKKIIHYFILGNNEEVEEGTKEYKKYSFKMDEVCGDGIRKIKKCIKCKKEKVIPVAYILND